MGSLGIHMCLYDTWGRLWKPIQPGMLKKWNSTSVAKNQSQASVANLEQLNPLLMGFLESRSKVNGSTNLGIAQLGSRRVFLVYILWKHLSASLTYGFCTSWKLEPPVARRVSRQRDKWFQPFFQSSEPWGVPLLSFCWYTDPINPRLLRFSVRLTGRRWGGEWRGLWGQFRQRQSQISSKTSILLPTTYTQGGQMQEVKFGSYSFGKTWELARKIMEESSPSEHLPI